MISNSSTNTMKIMITSIMRLDKNMSGDGWLLPGCRSSEFSSRLGRDRHIVNGKTNLELAEENAKILPSFVIIILSITDTYSQSSLSVAAVI